MRRQELIYAQTDGFTRNKVINNANTSSDICIFDSPIFNMTGATKIMSGVTSNSDGIHLFENDRLSIPFSFNFVDNLSSFSIDTNFNFNIYKFNDKTKVFDNTSIFKSQEFPYTSFISTNLIETSIPANILTIDGEYLIKSNYDYKVCTRILNELGLRNITDSALKGAPYNSYNSLYDYYFAVIYSARTPIFDLSPDTEIPLGALNSMTYIPTGETTFVLEDGYSGVPIITLNGLILTPDEDYVLNGNIVTLNDVTVADDILTMFYVGSGTTNGLVGETISIDNPILSGVTDAQGNEMVYYNTTTGKYEIFTNSDPISGNDIIVSINGGVLAPNIDYYQSLTDPRRLILVGDLVLGDIITIVYNANVTYINGVNNNRPLIYWTIDIPPQKINGRFILELSTNKEFTNIIFSSETQYVINNRVYNDTLEISGNIGDKMYYRVVNEKNYITITGDIIQSINNSEVIPIIIQSNSLNNY